MNKRYLYIIIAIIIIAVIGLLIYKASNKNKTIDIENITDEDVQKIVNSTNAGEFKIDRQDIQNFGNFEYSKRLARELGVPEKEIIENIQQLDDLMLN
jgi:hypothetical protein